MTAPRIVTVTLNPAIDRVLEVDQFAIGAHQRARRVGRYPAGKGINVSRVLATLGTRSIATGFIGREDLAMFEDFLERHGRGRVVMQLLMVRGRTRENITVMDPILDSETHIRDEGFSVQGEDVRRISSKVGMLARQDAMVCFTGSLPPGVTVGDLRSIMHRCQDAGARIVIDTSGSVCRDLREEPVWLVKLNRHELAEMSGLPTETEEQVIEAALSLSTEGGGQAEHVIGTLGAAGAILVGPNTRFAARVFVHPGRIANTVGCGDSLLAGLLHGYAAGWGWERSLAMGVAAATANAVSREPGTLQTADVDEFLAAAMMETLPAPPE
ncbi:MAG: 1-phosphofructokinase family hexose kinase [Planctomycetota bacterium]